MSDLEENPEDRLTYVRFICKISVLFSINVLNIILVIKILNCSFYVIAINIFLLFDYLRLVEKVPGSSKGLGFLVLLHIEVQ